MNPKKFQEGQVHINAWLDVIKNHIQGRNITHKIWINLEKQIGVQSSSTWQIVAKKLALRRKELRIECISKRHILKPMDMLTPSHLLQPN